MTAYCTVAQLAARLSSDATAVSDRHDEALQAAVDAAARKIDGHCGRFFYAEQTAVARYYWPTWDRQLRRWVVNIDDCWSITSVKFDGGDDGTYETTWAATTDYIARPRANEVIDGITGWPTTRLVLRSSTSIRTRPGDFEPVEVLGKGGWEHTPPGVAEANLIVAAQLAAMRQAPFGVAGFGEFGAVQVRDIKPARDLLVPLCKVGGTGLPVVA